MMEVCDNCGSENISSSPGYRSGYIDTCMDCGWWEEDIPEEPIDGFPVGCLLLFIALFGLALLDWFEII
jgi:hypothetical protein